MAPIAPLLAVTLTSALIMAEVVDVDVPRTEARDAQAEASRNEPREAQANAPVAETENKKAASDGGRLEEPTTRNRLKTRRASLEGTARAPDPGPG